MITHNSDQSWMASFPDSNAQFVIRGFRTADHAAVRHLYRRGVLGERLSPGDIPKELDDIEGTYFERPQDRLWIAEENNAVIGMVATSEDNNRVMSLRWLRVAPAWQRDGRVAGRLLKTAIEHARVYGCLKFVFHTVLERQRAVELLEGMGLQLSRIRDQAGLHLIELYDDLYARRPGQPH